jgi:hypothetical protein
MDHHVNVLSPIYISLWMLLSLKYEGMLHKGQQHSKGFEFNNSWEHPSSTTIKRVLMHLSFFSTTLNFHHHIPFECTLSLLFATLTFFAKVLLNAPLIFVATLNLFY